MTPITVVRSTGSCEGLTTSPDLRRHDSTQQRHLFELSRGMWSTLNSSKVYPNMMTLMEWLSIFVTLLVPLKPISYILLMSLYGVKIWNLRSIDFLWRRKEYRREIRRLYQFPKLRIVHHQCLVHVQINDWVLWICFYKRKISLRCLHNDWRQSSLSNFITRCDIFLVQMNSQVTDEQMTCVMCQDHVKSKRTLITSQKLLHWVIILTKSDSHATLR